MFVIAHPVAAALVAFVVVAAVLYYFLEVRPNHAFTDKLSSDSGEGIFLRQSKTSGTRPASIRPRPNPAPLVTEKKRVVKE